jgi:hypothetical protein
MEEESHGFMKGLTIGTLVTGIILAYAAFMTFDNSGSGGTGFWLLLLGGLLIWGSMWLLKKSDGFKRWSTLSDGQKALGYLIMFAGIVAGIIAIVAISAVKSELGRKD